MTLRTKWRCHVALQPIEDVIRKGEAASGDDAQYYCISEETFENVVLGAQVQRSDGLALVFNRVKDDDIRPVEIDLPPSETEMGALGIFSASERAQVATRDLSGRKRAAAAMLGLALSSARFS